MRMFKNYNLLSVIIGIGLMFLVSIPAMAQEGSRQQGQSKGSQPPPEISDAELEKAAEAYAKIKTIASKFQQSVQDIEDSDERQRLQKETNKKMVKAVENTGLDVATYNEIMGQVRANKEVQEKFLKKQELR